MNKLNLKKVVRDISKMISKNSPQILTGVGIAGMLTTTVLAVKATPRALELIEEAKVENEVYDLTPVEVVKAAWKPYIPAVVTGIASTACLIGANSVHTRRTAAIATAYKVSETALAEYKEKVIETIGEKKERVIEDKIAKDKVEKNPVSKSEVIITGAGRTLCMDALSGKYFESDIETIRKVVNELNRKMNYEMYISLTDFYNELGIPKTKISDELGWNIDKGLIEVTFSPQLAEDGKPCLVVDYLVAPRYDFSKLM